MIFIAKTKYGGQKKIKGQMHLLNVQHTYNNINTTHLKQKEI